MKRFFALLILLLVLATIAIYILIPATLKIAAVNIIPTNSEAAFRVISIRSNWIKWTIGDAPADVQVDNNGAFTKDGTSFVINEILHNAAKIKITQGNLQTSSLFTIMPVTKDSSLMQWESEISTGSNPLTKIQRYTQALALKKSINSILSNLHQFLEKQDNVYGYNFHVGSTTDTVLVAFKSHSTNYPDTKTIYNNIYNLQEYVTKKGGKQVAPPMLNITQTENNTYDYMVALPVDKRIVADLPYLYRQLVPGSFLITKIYGGEARINDALLMMQLYINDNGKTPVAIPFRRLITDRLNNPDSAKWETEIYFPIVR